MSQQQQKQQHDAAFIKSRLDEAVQYAGTTEAKREFAELLLDSAEHRARVEGTVALFSAILKEKPGTGHRGAQEAQQRRVQKQQQQQQDR